MRIREECPELEGVGPKIRAVRGFRDLSQNQLAYRTGISQKMISLYENGKQKPTIAVLVKISKALQVDINSFLEWDPETQPDTVFYTKIIHGPCWIDDPGLLKKIICDSIDAIAGTDVLVTETVT